MHRPILAPIALACLTASCGEETSAPDLSGLSVEVHLSSGCSCCRRWADYLRDGGAAVVTVEENDLSAFKSAQGVPSEAASCHTALVEGYVVEGHVPGEAMTKLLTDAPAAIGLAIPGMPSASPGMGGQPSQWKSLEVMLIGLDGELSKYAWTD